MAFLQSDVPPSTAPFRSRPASPAITRGSTRRTPSKWVGHVLAALIVAVLLAIPGYAAARATDSIAIGILAADIGFLIAVAVWSTVVTGARR